MRTSEKRRMSWRGSRGIEEKNQNRKEEERWENKERDGGGGKGEARGIKAVEG